MAIPWNLKLLLWYMAKIMEVHCITDADLLLKHGINENNYMSQQDKNIVL